MAFCYLITISRPNQNIYQALLSIVSIQDPSMDMIKFLIDKKNVYEKTDELY